jgi:SPP1 gp7 family putative phage head morphogenesis protein
MRNRGALPVPLSVIHDVGVIVNREFQAVIDECRNAVVMASAQVGKTLAGVSDDESQELIRHLIRALKERLKKAERDKVDVNTISAIKKQLVDAQTEFFVEFESDADDETRNRVAIISREETFANRLEGVRKGYLDNAIKRIGEGKSDLRKQFIQIFGDWIEGRGESLTGFEDVMSQAREEAGTFSKFFARDQFSRFNRALAISIYDEAGAKWVQWIAVNDGRTRRSHRAISGKVFAIDDLPEEYLQYNCRCAVIAVFELKGRRVASGDGISMNAKVA